MAEKVKSLDEIAPIEQKPSASAAKTISVNSFVADENIATKIVADYALQYLRKKVGFNSTREKYKAALDEFLTRKQ